MIGKLLGALFGYLLGGLIGALLGGYLGHLFDKAMAGNMASMDPQRQHRIQKVFFDSTFSVMGHIAKADGSVSQAEIQMAEALMTRMELSADMRREAIEQFNRGKAADFNLDQVLDEFRTECHRSRNLVQMFLEVQLQAAYADGSLHEAEERILLQVCDKLGIPRLVFEQIKKMFGASQRREAHRQTGTTLEEAYDILGVSASASDAEVKRAYRKLTSQHHPDKLVAKGLPEEMMKIANQKTQEIREAYEVIRDARQKSKSS